MLNEQRKREVAILEEQKQEQEYQNTFIAVAELNEKSYFYGRELLGPAPEDFDSRGSHWLDPYWRYYRSGSEKDGYHCFPYYRYSHFGISEIYLYTTNCHVFGIHVGDSKQDAVSTVEAEGYTLETEKEGAVKYVKSHISIWFSYSEEGIIEKIGIYVTDPYVESIVY